MIRIYLDWNVMSQMKNGSHSTLYDILKGNDSFIIFYSTAHIGDVFSSYSENKEQLELIKNDLQFISDLTNSHCILNNKDNQTYIDIINPQSLFEDRIKSGKVIENFSLDYLIESMTDIGLGTIGKQYVELIKSIPFDFAQTLNDPLTSKYLNDIFPGLKENPTIEGFFNSFMKMLNIMNNGIGYNDLRKVFQNGLNINRDKIFDSKNPFLDLEKYLKPMTEEGIDGLQKKINGFQNKKEITWFDNFINLYINLDMAGFQEDKVQIKNEKKQTFKNTTEDAFHSAFATLCDVYIINDKKGYKKTVELYTHQSINTKVFKPDEFVDYYDKYLNIKDGYKYLNLITIHLNSVKPFITPNENGYGYSRAFPSSFYFFNYFNKIYVIDFENQNRPTLLLSKDKPTNGKFTLFKEIEMLIKELNEYFGQDCNSKGRLKPEEFENLDQWKGRQWKLENLDLRLLQFNGYFQLYLDFKDE